MKIAPLVLIALVAGVAHADKPYTSKALGFSASYPYEVQEKTDPGGGGTAAGFDPQGIMYMVGVVVSDADMKKVPVKDQLDGGIAGAVQKVNGTLKSQKDVKLGKHPGREFEVDFAGGHATFRAYLVDQRTYLVGVVRKDGLTPPTTPADFFASFKLQPRG
jgi:hypothetical protein